MLAHALTLFLLAAPAAQPTQAFAPKHRPYDVEHYGLKVRLHNDGAFESTVDIRLTPTADLPVLELDAYGLTIKSVALEGGGALPFSQKDEPAQRTGWLRVKPASPFPRGKPLTLRIAFTGKAGTASTGLFTATAPDVKGALPGFFTQFEPSSARRFFPCNDEPYDKATTELEAVVDARYQVLSNGVKVKDEELTEGSERLRRVQWVQDKPHSTYLVALAVGQFEAVPVGTRVPAAIHVAPGRASLTSTSREITKMALPFEEDFLGVKYPWAKLDQVAVPGFLWGGMENTSLVLAREDLLVLPEANALVERPMQTGLVAHEMAHQWFGDLVTCQWWDDTWLNEGFATWLAWRAQDGFYNNDLVRVGRMARIVADYFREEDTPHSHPLVGRGAATPQDMFDPISYTKGASVLRMLEVWLGTDPFRKGIKAYLETYAYRNATSADFFAAMGKATGHEKDLAPFQQSWLTQRGYPVLTPRVELHGKAVRITLAQRPNHADEKGPFVFRLPVVLHRITAPAYTQEVTLTVDKPVVQLDVDLPALPEWVDWNREGAALARIDPSALSEQEWTLAARLDPDPVWRLLAYFALTEPLVNPAAPRNAEPSRNAVGMVAAGLALDASPYVRHAVLERLATAPRKRLPTAWGPVTFSLAQNPERLPPDPVGTMMVRRAALEVIGKIDYPRGIGLLREGIARKDLPLDLLSGYAEGIARLGDVAALQAALELNRPRGSAYVDAVAEAFGGAETPQVFAVLPKVLEQVAGNNEMAARIIHRLHDNTSRSSPEGVRFIRDFVLANRTFGDDVKVRMLRQLDEVKTPEARQALADVAQRSESERLRANARQVLDRNFGAGAGRPAAPPR